MNGDALAGLHFGETAGAWLSGTVPRILGLEYEASCDALLLAILDSLDLSDNFSPISFIDPSAEVGGSCVWLLVPSAASSVISGTDLECLREVWMSEVEVGASAVPQGESEESLLENEALLMAMPLSGEWPEVQLESLG